MDKKLKIFLDKNKIKYSLSEHKKVYTAFNEAETQHLKGKEVAKTVLVKTNDGFALVVVPAIKHVDNSLLKQKELVMSAGSYTESLEMKPKDFLKVVEAVKGSFGK